MNALYGLVLAGGHSSRMHEDKAALTIRRRPQLELGFRTAGAICFAHLGVGARRPVQ